MRAALLSFAFLIATTTAVTDDDFTLSAAELASASKQWDNIPAGQCRRT